jgi:hypothetical protein
MLQKTQQTLSIEQPRQWNFLIEDSFKNLPELMLNQYDVLGVSSFMGIFPEINHVWMTIDNVLFLWNYDGEGKQYLLAYVGKRFKFMKIWTRLL